MLRKRLGVKEPRWPPDFRERNADSENCRLKIPAVTFPAWHYCPFCGTMRKTTCYEPQPECDCYQRTNGRNVIQRQKKKTGIRTFCVVCPKAHIDDFPVAEWLHSSSIQPEHLQNPQEHGRYVCCPYRCALRLLLRGRKVHSRGNPPRRISKNCLHVQRSKALAWYWE